jgi:hypothetical protein
MSAPDVARNFSSRKFSGPSRRELKKKKDLPALVKMVRLLAQNPEMKPHTAAEKASRYTTGASVEAIRRRLVKRLKAAGVEYLETNPPADEFFKHTCSDPTISSENMHLILYAVLGPFLSHAAIEQWATEVTRVWGQPGETDNKRSNKEIFKQKKFRKGISNDLNFEISLLHLKRPSFIESFTKIAAGNRSFEINGPPN